MFDRYSERARQIIFLARYVAGMRGAEGIELDDILQSLIHEDQGDLHRMVSRMYPDGSPIMPESGPQKSFFTKLEAETLIKTLQKPPQGPQDMSTDMPISEEVKRVLISAPLIAGKTTEPLHLLAAIFKIKESPLPPLLAASGITRERVTKALGAPNGSPE